MELPNQVTEGPDEPSNQNGELNNERLSDSGGKGMVQKEQAGTLGDGINTRVEEQKSLQEPLLNGNGHQGGGRKDCKDDITPLMDDKKDEMEKEKKRKMRGKRKAVKFTDQDLGDENLEDNGQKKSKGR